MGAAGGAKKLLVHRQKHRFWVHADFYKFRLYAHTPQGPVAVDLPNYAQGMWINQLAMADNGDLWMSLWASGVSRRHDEVWFTLIELLTGIAPAFDYD